MYSLSTMQFVSNFKNYKKLKEEGITVKAETKFIPRKYDADYYHLEFITTDGKTVTKTGKCGDKEGFDDFYADLKVVYHLDDPDDYLELPYFENYSLGYKIFFFFGLYGIIGTMVIYGFLNFGYIFKDKSNREKIKKTLPNN